MGDSRQYNNSAMGSWSDSPYDKPRKPWGRIALFLIILGAVLFAAGWLSGSRGGRVYFENGIRIATYPLETHETSATAANLTFGSNIHTVTVNTTSCAIRIVPTSSDTVQVVSIDSRRVTVDETDGRLYVRARHTGGMQVVNGVNVNIRRGSLFSVGTLGVSWNRTNDARFLDFNFDPSSFSFANFNNTIRVYVPDRVQYIEARSTSGSVRLENVSTRRLNLRSTSGSVGVEGGTHENASLQSTSGSVRANGYIVGDIYARSTSGSVNIQDYSTSHRNTNAIQLRSTSGSVRFETRAPLTDFRYDLTVTSGSMRVDGRRIDGRRTSGGNGTTPITARSTSGSVQLYFSR